MKLSTMGQADLLSGPLLCDVCSVWRGVCSVWRSVSGRSLSVPQCVTGSLAYLVPEDC